MNAYLVDDEQLALNRLSRLLQQTGRVQILGATTDPSHAIEFLSNNACDVVFSDINMPEVDGFEMLAQLDSQPLVVFTTAYSEHALRAFEVNSVDYLLKPIEPEQLDRALKKLERIRGGLEPRPDLAALLAQLSRAKAYPARLPSRIGDRVEFVDLSRVTHFYANDKLTYAATPKKDFVVNQTISELESKLDPARFIRVHRSTIVNIDFVKEMHSWFSDRLLLRLNDGKDTEVSVSRDRVKQLKEKLGV